MDINTRRKLDHAVTEWDQKQSTRRGYNPNALGIYLQTLNAAEVKTEAFKNKNRTELEAVRIAVEFLFNDRLRDFLLKAIEN